MRPPSLSALCLCLLTACGPTETSEPENEVAAKAPPVQEWDGDTPRGFLTGTVDEVRV